MLQFLVANLFVAFSSHPIKQMSLLVSNVTCRAVVDFEPQVGIGIIHLDICGSAFDNLEKLGIYYVSK